MKTFIQSQQELAETSKHEPEVTDYLNHLISQVVHNTVEYVTEQMKMEGDMHKLTPFQETVNTYIKNRGEEIIKDITKEDCKDKQ